MSNDQERREAARRDARRWEFERFNRHVDAYQAQQRKERQGTLGDCATCRSPLTHDVDHRGAVYCPECRDYTTGIEEQS